MKRERVAANIAFETTHVELLFDYPFLQWPAYIVRSLFKTVIVTKLCTTTCYLLAFTVIYWHIQKRQTPQVTVLYRFKN